MKGISKQSSSRPYLLRCSNLSKYYGNIAAISNLTFNSFTSFLGLLGPNGSGKSTLIKMMLGLLHPDNGEIELGMDRENVRMIPDYPLLPENITIDEWMDIMEQFYGPSPKNVDLETEFRLSGSWKLGGLSVGQKRLVSLMPVFFGEPGLLILDEPTNFLDVIMREKVLDLIKEQIQRTNCRVIIASHRFDEIELLASEIVILNHGKLEAKISMKHDASLGFQIRVNNNEAFEQYLKTYDLEYKIEDTLMGKSFRINDLDKVLDTIRDFTRDGGLIFNVSAVNQLQERLGELK